MVSVHQYQVIGRKAPTARDPEPQIFRMRIFATNTVTAQSRFWYLLHRLHKLKKTTGDVLAVNEIVEKNARIVNTYGIVIRYDSRSGTHNMYKEYRDTKLTGAVEQMYAEMAGLHRARSTSIQIIKTCTVASKDVRRPKTLQFINSKVKFPMTGKNRISRASSKQFRSTFKANRPSTVLN